MTTEREYQEGQDRLRRAQGKNQWLRGKSKGSPYPRYSNSANPRRWFPWVLAAIVAISIYGTIKARESRPPEPTRSAPESLPL